MHQLIEGMATLIAGIVAIVSLDFGSAKILLTPSSVSTATTTVATSTRSQPEAFTPPEPPKPKLQTHSELDTESSQEYNVYKETNSISFATDNWRNFAIASMASEYGFTMHIPKDWIRGGPDSYKVGEAKVVQLSPPGIVILNEGQSCLDTFPETSKLPDPDWGLYETVIKQQQVTHNGKELVWSQVRSNRNGTLNDRYCLEEGDLALIITFYESSKKQSELRDIMTSVTFIR